MGKISFG